MQKKWMQKRQFESSGKTVTVYPSKTPDRPVVYLNTFGDEGEKVYQLLQQNQCPDFTFVTVGGLAWDRDMAPWDIPPVSKFDTPCTGGASSYLQLLTKEIIPKAEETAAGKILWRGLAGYSIGGLFAVYALYHAEAFSRIASVSGSLWYPGLMEYVRKQETKVRPSHIYFSLGSKESRTRNPILKTVQENTETIKRLYENTGVDTVFDLNPGGHYTNAAGRNQEMPSPENPTGQCAYLMNIYTLPTLRGQGVGRAIVQWLVGRALQRNISKIYLETSEAGKRLYSKTGFVPMPDMMKWIDD